MEPSRLSPTRRALDHRAPLPRAVDLPRAGRGRRARDLQERELPLQLRRLAQLPAQPVDPAAPRGRPGRRDHHPQRRPLGRLGDGAHRLPHRQALHRAARPPGRGGARRVPPGRRGPRPRQRRAGGVRRRAGAGDHARHPLHLPRHHAHLGGQRPDQRRRPAAGVPPPRHPHDARHPVADDPRGRRPRRRRLLPPHRPRWPRALRDRLRPRRRRPLRPARTPSPAGRVRPQRRARRTRRRPLHRPLRHRELQRRLAASSSRPWPRP